MKQGINSYNKSEIQVMLTNQKGVSLIAMAFFLVGLGLFTMPAMQIYKSYEAYRSEYKTDNQIAKIQTALSTYLVENGRYPCPAPLDAGIDAATFGVEVSTDCGAGNIAGTFRAQGRGGRWVRTGTVPVRTLGLPDSYMFDGYRTRYVYAVTEVYAVAGQRPPSNGGAIRINDGNDNNATELIGNIVQIVFSMGEDQNGSYDTNGVIIQNCDPTARSGENCDFANNAVFMNTLRKSKSLDPNNAFVHTMSYAPSKDVVPCEDAMAAVMPKNTIFLVDTSGSMALEGTPGVEGSPPVTCPSGMTAPCSRMDLAHWAMRRAMPARLSGNAENDDPGATALTGFKCVGVATKNYSPGVEDDCDSTHLTQSSFDDITFDDPTADGYSIPEDPDEAEVMFANKLEGELENMCPSTNTPLGVHMEQLAQKLGDGTKDRPNKITVLSDGEDNTLRDGRTLATIATQIKKDYPNLQIDIVDVSNNPMLQEVATITGGKYFSTNNPDELVDSLYSSVGVCKPANPPAPIDKKNCIPKPPKAKER